MSHVPQHRLPELSPCFSLCREPNSFCSVYTDQSHLLVHLGVSIQQGVASIISPGVPTLNTVPLTPCCVCTMNGHPFLLSIYTQARMPTLSPYTHLECISISTAVSTLTMDVGCPLSLLQFLMTWFISPVPLVCQQ